MTTFHAGLESRWQRFSIFEQMANIGAEIGRAMSWQAKNNFDMSRNAIYRGLELIDFTTDDPKNKSRLSEILRMREMLIDYFFGDNVYRSTDLQWEKYFYPFNFAARNK